MRKSTRKEVWKETKKKFPSEIREKEYNLIILSSSISSVVAILLSNINFETVKPLTRIVFVDLLIYALLLSFLAIAVVRLFLNIINFLNRIGHFFYLVKKRKTELLLEAEVVRKGEIRLRRKKV